MAPGQAQLRGTCAGCGGRSGTLELRTDVEALMDAPPTDASLAQACAAAHAHVLLCTVFVLLTVNVFFFCDLYFGRLTRLFLKHIKPISNKTVNNTSDSGLYAFWQPAFTDFMGQTHGLCVFCKRDHSPTSIGGELRIRVCWEVTQALQGCGSAHFSAA